MPRQSAHRRVADAIRADFAALTEGDRLPSTRELAERYEASVGTVARAIELLQAEGVVTSRHGLGVYARVFDRITRSSPDRLSREHWGRGHTIQNHDTGARLRVAHVDVDRRAAPPEVAATLGVPAGERVLVRDRRYAVDHRPVQLAVSYLPLDVVAAAPALEVSDPGPGGIYAQLADAGYTPHHFTERVTCRWPTRAEATALYLPTGTPVIEITRYAYTAADRIVEVNQMVLDANAYVLEYHFTG